MADAEDLLARFERTRFGWGWSDLDRVYTGFGFAREEGKKHTLYIHPDYPELRATVGRHNTLAAGYVNAALKLIKRLKELQASKDECDEQE